MQYRRYLVVLAFAALSLGPQAVALAQQGQVPTGGTFERPPGGAIPKTDAPLPASLTITQLAPFTHPGTGLTGLGPANWKLFSGRDAFQISSSPEAPDGFIGLLVPADNLARAALFLPSGATPADLPAVAQAVLGTLKQNSADGPAPEILAESMGDDGSGILLVSTTATAQGSVQPIRVTTYARTTSTPSGLVIAIAMVPADLFPAEEAFVRQMVDALRLS